MAERQIISGTEPFYFPGGPVGCLLVHGFTGTPKEMRSLGEYLNGQGHTVLGVRLAGHATQIDDMIRTNFCDWMASVEDGYHLLKSHTDKIFLMGLSMGGVLSLTQAARLDVDGVVAMSTPYEMPVGWIQKFPWVLPIASPFYKQAGKSEGIWFNPDVAEDHISYDYNPTRSAYQLHQLLHVMRDHLPQIKVPALVIHSKDDDYVLQEHAGLLFEAIGSEQKDLIYVDKANHVITRDGDVMRVYEPIKEFVERNSG